jgi:hypothetical protein
MRQRSRLQNRWPSFVFRLGEGIGFAAASLSARTFATFPTDVIFLHILLRFLTITPTRRTNFSNLFWEWNSTCFGQFLCPSSGVFHCTNDNGMCHTGLLTACERDRNGTAVLSWSCSQTVSKPVWHIPLPCVQWKTPDDGQRNCPKHVEFHSKDKFEKLVKLVGFIVRNLTRCTVTWTSNSYTT